MLLASARDGTGIGELADTLDAHRRFLVESDGLEVRRRRGREGFVLESLRRRYGSFGLEQVGGPEAVTARVRAEEDLSSFALVATLGVEIEEALRKAGPRAGG